MKLADDTPDEERIGGRDLTRWPTPVGRGLVQVVSALAAHVSAHMVLYITAAVGLALVVGLTATDVILAWLLGAAWLALLITSHRLYLTIRRVAPSDPAREAG